MSKKRQGGSESSEQPQFNCGRINKLTTQSEPPGCGVAGLLQQPSKGEFQLDFPQQQLHTKKLSHKQRGMTVCYTENREYMGLDITHQRLESWALWVKRRVAPSFPVGCSAGLAAIAFTIFQDSRLISPSFLLLLPLTKLHVVGCSLPTRSPAGAVKVSPGHSQGRTAPLEPGAKWGPVTWLATKLIQGMIRRLIRVRD